MEAWTVVDVAAVGFEDMEPVVVVVAVAAVADAMCTGQAEVAAQTVVCGDTAQERKAADLRADHWRLNSQELADQVLEIEVQGFGEPAHHNNILQD